MDDGPGAPPKLKGLFLGQATTAFNDNAYNLMVAMIAIAAVPGYAAMPDGAKEDATQLRTTVAFVTFTVPLLLLSLPAGALADRVSKRKMLVALKAGEALLMAAAAAAL